MITLEISFDYENNEATITNKKTGGVVSMAISTHEHNEETKAFFKKMAADLDQKILDTLTAMKD